MACGIAGGGGSGRVAEEGCNVVPGLSAPFADAAHVQGFALARIFFAADLAHLQRGKRALARKNASFLLSSWCLKDEGP